MKSIRYGITAVALLLTSACTVAPDDVTRLVKQEGITDFHDTGYAFWGCGEGDTFHSGFTGIKNRRQVTGVICGGFVKGYTIRYF